MPPLKRFPENPVTPHGAYHVLHDRIPWMGLSSFDERSPWLPSSCTIAAVADEETKSAAKRTSKSFTVALQVNKT